MLLALGCLNRIVLRMNCVVDIPLVVIALARKVESCTVTTGGLLLITASVSAFASVTRIDQKAGSI